MSDQQAKKLNLALHLNPVVSTADRVAMAALHQWYEKTRQSYDDPAAPELDGIIRAFHHDIYLAGLHLYLINPRLCSHVALALEQTDLTLDSLLRQLTACGLWSGSAEAPEKQNDNAAFSPAQLEQLERLLASVAPAGGTSQAQENGAVPALLQQLTEQRAQLTAMQAELQRLRALAEEQAQQLRQIRSLAPAAPAPEAAKPKAAEELDVSGMGPQIAQMQKVRQKGVF